jgi:hypothetical protein
MSLPALVAACLLAGCGVPDDTRPRALDPADVPEELLEPAPSSTAAPPPEEQPASIEIYLVNRAEDRLEAATRGARHWDIPMRIDALLEGPTEAEADGGLHSAIPAETRRLNIEHLQPTVATIDLSREFTAADDEAELLALAQVVYTVTEQSGVTGVSLLVEGEPQEGTDDGRLDTAGPLRRAHFKDVAPSR